MSYKCLRSFTHWFAAIIDLDWNTAHCGALIRHRAHSLRSQSGIDCLRCLTVGILVFLIIGQANTLVQSDVNQHHVDLNSFGPGDSCFSDMRKKF